jgi:hypothetical protein
MTDALEPDLAVAYVRELSAAVRGVIVLTDDGERLAGPEKMAEPARALLGLLEGEGIVRMAEGIVWVASHGGRTLMAAAGPQALPGSTALDVAAALGSTRSLSVLAVTPPVQSVARRVIGAT